MNLFAEDLPEGITILRECLDRDGQERFIELCRKIIRISPLVQPTMRDGTPFHLKVTSCGDCGWFSDKFGFRYLDRHPETGQPWAKMPEEFLELSQRAASAAGEQNYQPDTCLINLYPKGTGKLGLHRDLTEADQRTGIITLSLGDTCLFAIGDVSPKTKPQLVQLNSGDVVAMTGRGRHIYHGVEGLYPDTSNLLKNGGRISLTFRKARL